MKIGITLSWIAEWIKASNKSLTIQLEYCLLIMKNNYILWRQIKSFGLEKDPDTESLDIFKIRYEYYLSL